MHAKIENERLLFVRLNQNKLRVYECIHLKNVIANDGNDSNVGKLVISPSSFTGGPRYTHE
jgi:Helitron helicase-like domain at N-terminus